MKEEQVHPVPGVTNAQATLAANKREVAAEFEEKALELRNERGLELGLGVLVRVTVRVRADNLIEFARTLDRPLSFFDGWDWEEEIDPLEDGDTYEFWVELANKVPETFDWLDEKELPILSVYSKDGDNHAGWPAAFVLAARLANELRAVEPDQYPRQPNNGVLLPKDDYPLRR